MRISVILPVYDPPIERFQACIASVVVQNYDNWELIVVDDGSEDEAIQECLETLSVVDERIRVHRQFNAGPGAARNAGTRLATGDYVTYLDADDELPPYTVRNAVDAIWKSDAQLVMGYLQRVHEVRERRERCSTEYDVLGRDGARSLYDFTLAGIDRIGIVSRQGAVMKNGPIARFIQTPIAQAVPFPERLQVGEDTVWNLELFQTVDTICVCESIWYWYWVAHDSTSRGFREDAPAQATALFSILEERLPEPLSERDRALALIRIVNEVHRVARTYYSRPEAKIPVIARLRGVRLLLRSSRLSRGTSFSAVLRLGPGIALKYFLCWSGLAPVYWCLDRLTGKGTQSRRRLRAYFRKES